jgi:hypothetical protein
MLQPHQLSEDQVLSEGRIFTISLPDDDSFAMALLCDILHLRSKEVHILSEKITLDRLASIATTVDKYECATAIQPWPHVWLSNLLSPEKRLNAKDMTIEEITKWIHISYHLGYEEQIQQCTSVLIRTTKLVDLQASGGCENIPGYVELSGKVRGM